MYLLLRAPYVAFFFDLGEMDGLGKKCDLGVWNRFFFGAGGRWTLVDEHRELDLVIWEASFSHMFLFLSHCIVLP